MAEITVNNFGELRNALTDTTSTVINLGGNIDFSSGGAVVNRNKGDIVINGNGYTITDYNSTGAGDAIRIPDTAGPAINFTIQNVVWNGRNYYGVTQVPETDNGSNVTLILKNMQYTGPQAIHNRRGITKVIDSDFIIDRNTGSTNPQEFGEVNRISFEGNVNITSSVVRSGALYSIIWLANSNSSLRVEDNAVLKISAPTTYMFYADATPMPAMTFGQNSDTVIETQSGLYYNASATYHLASSFTLEKGASFTATQSQRNGTVPFFKCRDSFTMEEGSFLHLAVPPSGSAALMYFSAIATLNFNNPKSVVLYNNGGNVFSFNSGSSTNPNIINMDAELINIWSSAASYTSAGTFDDPPTRAFAKLDGDNITAEIKTSSSSINTINSNIEDGDKGFPMNSSTFNVLQAKVLSLGNLRLTVDQISDSSTAITGSTEPLANLRAIYNGSTLNGNADAGGVINLDIPSSIPINTTVSFGSNWKFLTKYIEITVVGSVRITYLSDLVFKDFFTPCNRSIIKRKKTDWYVEVTDTRTSGSDWYLYASLPLPLSKGSDTLDNALTFTEGTSIVMSSEQILIKQGSRQDPPPTVTHITWNDIEGFLIRVVPGSSFNPGKYVSTMYWQVRTTPLP